MVIGGGVIGLEFACIYEALGSQVTVLEMAPSILPDGTDEAIAKRLQILLRRRGMAIQTGTTVERIEKAGEALRVVTAGAGGEAVFEGERVLIATGRWPNTQAMGFEEVGLRMNGRAIAVDERLATNLPNVWAIGDAVGGWMLAHKAMVEGRVAAENATGGQRRIDYRSVPNVIFTRPEVASVGLTEAQARSEGADVKVSQFAFSANPKARILGECDGLVRLVCEAGSGRSPRRAPDGAARHRSGRRGGVGRADGSHGRRSGVDDPRPSDAAGGNARSRPGVPRCSHPHALSLRRRHVRVP